MFVVIDKFEILNVYLFSFESDWRSRSEILRNADGFIQFELMRGKVAETFTTYNRQTKWVSKGHFLEWLNSKNFNEIKEEIPSNFSFHYSFPTHECFELVI